MYRLFCYLRYLSAQSLKLHIVMFYVPYFVATQSCWVVKVLNDNHYVYCSVLYINSVFKAVTLPTSHTSKEVRKSKISRFLHWSSFIMVATQHGYMDGNADWSVSWPVWSNSINFWLLIYCHQQVLNKVKTPEVDELKSDSSELLETREAECLSLTSLSETMTLSVVPPFGQT